MPDNLYADVPNSLPAEQFLPLLTLPGLTIERIVSTGQSTPADEWFDQPQHEWVILLRGAAEILFADEPAAPVSIKPGDYLHILPHRRHRVTFTSSNEPTVWLAVHYEPTMGEPRE